MGEERGRSRLEEDDYELQRLQRRQQRQREAYMKKRRRERLILFALCSLLALLLLTGVTAYFRTKKKSGGSEATETDPRLSSSATAASAESRTEEKKVTLPAVSSETASSASADTTAETPAETTPEASAETTAAVTETVYIEPSAQGPDTVFTKKAELPSWITKDLLNISEKNRPGVELTAVNNVVIHWVGNAASSAKDNRDYFESLANPKVNTEGIGASSHFIVGLEGEILQCVPIEEVAYANYPRNYDTISIEVCHPDWEGKFSDLTYASVVRLAAWVLETYGLTADALIRHYDVRGKECPLYYVQHPEAWEQLKADVRQYMSEHPDIANEFP